MSDAGRQIGLALASLMTTLATVAGAAGGEHGLVAAARNHDPQQMRRLLTETVDVNVRSDDGSTALLWTAHWNDVETAALLVRAGADANATNDFHITPLSQACTNGSAAFVQLLLKAGANPNTPIATGETPLMTCAGSGSADAVKLLLAHGADVDAREPSQHQTALMWAAAEHHSAVVQMLIEARADLRARTRNGFTALHFAAREGDVATTQLLLAAGVDINIRSQPDSSDQGSGGEAGPRGAPGTVVVGRNEASVSAGSTPLLVATVRAQVPLALFLLERGADPDAAEMGFTALHWAATTWEGGVSNPVYGFEDPMSGIPNRQAKLQLVKALLAHGADPNRRMTRRPPGFAGGFQDAVGATPFLLASSVDDIEMMRLLLAAGADPTMVTASGTTSLMAAAALNHGVGESPVTEAQALEAVKLLLDLGIEAGGVTSLNENALFGPAYRGWNILLELLIEQGADVNVVSKAGITPWRAASGQGDRLGGVLFNKEGAEILRQHGADPTLGRPCLAQGKCR
jgi:ankyrin repeat protein